MPSQTIFMQPLHNTARLTLSLLGLVYLFAFSSLFTQLPGLYQVDGIQPVDTFLQRLHEHLDVPAYTRPSLDQFARLPTVFWLVDTNPHDDTNAAVLKQDAQICPLGWLEMTPRLASALRTSWLPELAGMCVALPSWSTDWLFSMPVDQAMDWAAGVGMVLSVVLVVVPLGDWSTLLVTASLWLLYLSFVVVGQTFLHFQWDSLMVEAGFLALFLQPRKTEAQAGGFAVFRSAKNRLALFGLHFLLFRLMFASGAVKLISKGPTWWDLTALHYHFETTCIPSPASWWMSYVDANGMAWLLQVSVALTLTLEVLMPFLLFDFGVPLLRRSRIGAAYAQILLQLVIIATGNYSFFNLLTIVLCVAAFDDEHLKGPTPLLWARGVAVMGVVGLASLAITKLFLRLTFTPDFSEWGVKLTFDQAQFDAFISYAVPASMLLCLISFKVHALCALFEAVWAPGAGVLKRAWRLVRTAVFVVAMGLLLAVSFVPFTQPLHDETHKRIPHSVSVAYHYSSGFHITSSYGLFRRMTTERREVIFQGRTSQDGTWKSYRLPFQPGPLKRAPPMVAPHQPRLDWQMWFAALGSYQHNPWLVHTAVKLLQGSPAVLELFDRDATAAALLESPPEEVRVVSYRYKWNLQSNTTKWWRRSDRREYLPRLDRTNNQLLHFVSSNGWKESARLMSHQPHEGPAERRLAFEAHPLTKVRRAIVRGISSTPRAALLALLLFFARYALSRSEPQSVKLKVD